MALALGEAHHLVLDRRAVARAPAADPPGIDRRAVEVLADRVVRRRVGPGDVAVDLGRRDPPGHRRERLRRVVALLAFEPGPVDGAPVDPGRRAGLEPAEREPGALQRLGERDRGRVAHPPGRPAVAADVDDAPEERAGGEHHGAGRDRLAGLRHDARRAPRPARARCPPPSPRSGRAPASRRAALAPPRGRAPGRPAPSAPAPPGPCGG